MPPEYSRIDLDSAALKALAHPLRVQLIGALRKQEVSTATQLGERLGISSGSASYHLRQLEKAGLVAEDTTRGNARERWWRAVHAMSVLDEDALEREDPDAVDSYLRSVATAYTLNLQHAVNERATMPVPWRTAMELSDYSLQLTPDEARTLAARLHAVVREFRYDVPGRVGPEGSERVTVVLQLLPQPDVTETS